jgi:hypothetical protein
LRQLARRGIVEKDATGRWRLTEEEPEPYDDVSVTPEAERLEPEPGAQSRWIRNVNDYGRVESDIRDRPMRYG